MKTLEQILEDAKKSTVLEDSLFGIEACKEHIVFMRDHFHKSLYQMLEEYVDEANRNVFFNSVMVLACWELINGRE